MSKEQHDYFLPAKDEQAAPLTRWQLNRLRGRDILIPHAQLKLEWIVSYHTIFEKNATQTALHFGISRKTLHKWLRRFDEKNLSSLEEESRAPEHTRKRQISFLQCKRIIILRNAHMK